MAKSDALDKWLSGSVHPAPLAVACAPAAAPTREEWTDKMGPAMTRVRLQGCATSIMREEGYAAALAALHEAALQLGRDARAAGHNTGGFIG